MNDGQNGQSDKVIHSETSEYLSEYITPESSGVETTIQIKGAKTLKVLNFFYNNRGQWTCAQVSRFLKMPYQTVMSAFKRLSRCALITRLSESWTMLDDRRQVAGNVLKNPGKKVSINTGLESYSDTKGALGRVPRVSEKNISLRPWREIIGFDSGWKENTRITKVWLDPFIIKNIRSVIPGAGVTTAEWKTVNSDTFTLQISKVRTVQLWIKGATWREDLAKFLQKVPNLEERHLDIFWNKVDTRAKHLTTTREFHVTDPGLAKSRVHLFRGSRSWGRLSENNANFCEESRRTRSRVRRLPEGRGQRVHELSWTIRSSCNISTHLRERDAETERIDEEGIRGEIGLGYFQGERANVAEGGIC